MYVYVRIHACVCICIQTNMYVYHIYIYIYICTYIYMYTSTVYIYIWPYSRTGSWGLRILHVAPSLLQSAARGLPSYSLGAHATKQTEQSNNHCDRYRQHIATTCEMCAREAADLQSGCHRMELWNAHILYICK